MKTLIRSSKIIKNYLKARLKYSLNVGFLLFSDSEQSNEGEGDCEDGGTIGEVEKHF